MNYLAIGTAVLERLGVARRLFRYVRTSAAGEDNVVRGPFHQDAPQAHMDFQPLSTEEERLFVAVVENDLQEVGELLESGRFDINKRNPMEVRSSPHYVM